MSGQKCTGQHGLFLVRLDKVCTVSQRSLGDVAAWSAVDRAPRATRRSSHSQVRGLGEAAQPGLRWKCFHVQLDEVRTVKSEVSKRLDSLVCPKQ